MKQIICLLLAIVAGQLHAQQDNVKNIQSVFLGRAGIICRRITLK